MIKKIQTNPIKKYFLEKGSNRLNVNTLGYPGNTLYPEKKFKLTMADHEEIRTGEKVTKNNIQ